MEEILASIRRIIADDQTLPGNRREREDRRRRESADAGVETPAAAQNYPEPAEAIALDEDEIASVMTVEEEKPQPPAIAEIRHLRLNRALVEQAAPAEEPEEAEAEEEVEDEEEFSSAYEPDEASEGEALVSSSTATSVASHFEALAASMIFKDSGLLQQYAQEMMRPMLKQWLDDNLPVIVERLVRAEIERVARGGRR